MLLKKINVVVFSLVLTVLSGCASFEKAELSKVTELPDVSQYENKPSAYVDLTFYRGLPNENPVEVSQAIPQVRPVVDNAFKNSDLFKDYTFDESSEDEHDYTIKINIYNHADNGVAAVSGFITGFTLGLIPGSATDNYTLELQAIDGDGRVLSKYSNKDSIQTWIGIWFIPAMGNTPEKAMGGTLENQVKTALKELIESGVMKYSYLKYLDSNV